MAHTPMPDTNLGNVRITDEETQRMLTEVVASFGGNRSEAIRQTIRYYYQNKLAPAPVTLGYIAIDRRGDLDADTACPECGEPLTKPFLWFADNGTFGIVCGICATSK